MLATASYFADTTSDIMIEPVSVVDECIRQRLADCSYRFCFRNVDWDFDGSTLTLRGRVPTFYLKQVLQTILRGINHVEELVNEVDVISTTGLSSVSAK